MALYTIERVDVSTISVEASTPEEALMFATNDPDGWSFDAGDMVVVSIDDSSVD